VAANHGHCWSAISSIATATGIGQGLENIRTFSDPGPNVTQRAAVRPDNASVSIFGTVERALRARDGSSVSVKTARRLTLTPNTQDTKTKTQFSASCSRLFEVQQPPFRIKASQRDAVVCDSVRGVRNLSGFA